MCDDQPFSGDVLGPVCVSYDSLLSPHLAAFTRHDHYHSLADACESGGEDEVQQLLARPDVEVDRFNGLPLLLAAKHGHNRVLQQLLEAGASLSSPNGQMAMHAAAKSNHAQCLRVLCASRDASSLMSLQRNGRTPLMVASARGCTSAVAALLEFAGCGVHIQDATGRTALHLAAKNGHTLCVRLLLEGGADPLARTDEWQTPIELAARKGHLELAAELEAYAQGHPMLDQVVSMISISLEVADRILAAGRDGRARRRPRQEPGDSSGRPLKRSRMDD